MERQIDEILNSIDEILPDAIKTSNERKNIAESLKPTVENVAQEFVIGTMYHILINDKSINFKFDFREDEAIDFIEGIIKSYPYEYKKERLQKVLESLKKRTEDNDTQPVMVIRDYKKFFELLVQVYKQDIELFFKRTKMSTFPVYEMENFLSQIWLRATPEDFNNPEKFLSIQLEMLKDKTFAKYDEEKILGKLSFLDNHVLCVKNRVARTWDENLREMEFTIYDKNHYDNPHLFWKPQYTLPVIRYGIYEKDGKKVCRIGSIQNTSISDDSNDKNIGKKLERKKYKLNSNVPQEDTERIEPKNILALSIFINLLNGEGITEIEAPGMYVLDYEYHQKRSEMLLDELARKWPKERIAIYPERFERAIIYMKRNYEKEDLISEIKTERFIRTLTRMLHHYPNATVKSYPGEADSFLHMSIPEIKNKEEIRGEVLRDIYDLINSKEHDEER